MKYSTEKWQSMIKKTKSLIKEDMDLEKEEVSESTDILDSNGILITQFNAGGKGNINVQINKSGKYIQLSPKEAVIVANSLKKWAKKNFNMQ